MRLRSLARVLSVPAVCAALLVGTAATAVASSPTAADRSAATSRAAAAFTCSDLDADLPNVFGRDCDSHQWGPVADFTITNRGTGEQYQCRTGWAEGSQWVSGQDCAPVDQ